MTSYTKEIDKNDTAKFAQIIKEHGLVPEQTKSEYETDRFRGNGITVVIYSSGKILAQGKDVSQFAKWLEGESKVDTAYEEHIGADEVGKGDYFGPLVVAAAYLPVDSIVALDDLTVLDSKRLSDERIMNSFPKIAELCKYSTKVISPKEYAERIAQTQNINILLSEVHMENINKLLLELADDGIECKKVVIDQFSPRKDRLVTAADRLLTRDNVEIVQFHGGESDTVVAIASMIARATFLSEWDNMEQEYQFSFPKGSSNVIEAAQRFVLMYGEDALRDVAKVSFSITSKVIL